MKYLDEIWAFIPARSGSSLKNKNIRDHKIVKPT